MSYCKYCDGSGYSYDGWTCGACGGSGEGDDPYQTDEWYEDDEDTVPVELPAQPQSLKPLAGARNLIALIIVFVYALFRRRDHGDQIPF